MRTHRSLACLAFLPASLAACGGQDAGDASVADIEAPPADLLGYHTQGYHTQGMDKGTDDLIKGFRLSSLVADGSPADHAYVAEAGIVVEESHVYPGGASSMQDCAAPTAGEWRNCGWRSGGVGLCTPGTVVALGSAPGGACGACTGDTMLRVCAGETACDFGGAGLLGSNDDSCGLCSQVSFVCPGSGSFSVLLAPYYSAADASLAVGASSGAFPHINRYLEGPELTGRIIQAEYSDGSVHDYRIGDVQPLQAERVVPSTLAPTGPVWRYVVEGWSEPDSAWTPVCGPDPVDNYRGAVVEDGTWDASGHHLLDPAYDLVSFGCPNGVVYKCSALWGYFPFGYAAAPGGWVSGWDEHQTCTRLARADYCGTGHSWTKDGTLINSWDNHLPPIQVRGDPDPEFFFEAGWTPDGASCLSKKRWDDAPDEVFTCPQLTDWQTMTQKTCEYDGQGSPYLDPTIVHLFNESKFNAL